MTEYQFSGLLIILVGVVPAYFLANYIQKHKRYSLFSGWDPSKIRDEEAYGNTLCKGLRVFAFTLGMLAIAIFLNLARSDMAVIFSSLVTMVPLFYYMVKAKKLYGK